MKKDYADIHVNMKDALPDSREANILDYGCGTGRAVDYFLDIGYKNIDVSDIDLQLMNQVVKKHGCVGIEPKELLDQYTSRESKYDLILTKEVIFYLEGEEMTQLLVKLGAMLKPQGKLVIFAFNGATATAGFVKLKDPGIKLILTEHSLKYYVERAGLVLSVLRGNKPTIRGIKSYGFILLQKFWKGLLWLVYFLERGIDSQNPKILDKHLVAIVTKKSSS